MISVLAKHETLQMIDGPEGKIELIRAEATATPRGAWGIVCHPHPQQGGTMYNKVVTTLSKTFQGLGVNTVRFNFRGVGKSDGRFDKGRGEIYDLLAVLNWVLDEKPNQEIWLAGFSFGAYIAAKTAHQVPIDLLVTVAPPVTHFPMETPLDLKSPWILVQGEKDEVIPARDVFRWAEKQTPPPTILRFPKAGHFFHGELTALKVRLEESINLLMPSSRD